MSYFVVCTRVNSYHAHRLPLCYVGRSIEQCDNSCHRCLCAGAVGGTRRSGRLIKQMSAGSRRARAQSPSPAHVATTDSSSRRYEAAVHVCLWPSTLCVCVCVCRENSLCYLTVTQRMFLRSVLPDSSGKQAVRVATQYAPPLSFLRGRPSASRAAEQTQHGSSFPRRIRSHADR